MVLNPQAVPRSIDLPGRVVALATAEIRPQVDGIVQKLVFTEGGTVAANDPLYELDTRKFKAALDAAQAALKKPRPLKRVRKSRWQGTSSSRRTMPSARRPWRTPKQPASISAMPRSGRRSRAIISKSAITVGALATIRQLDPIHVDLVDSSANLLRIRDQVQEGTLGRADKGPPKVRLTLENGKPYGKDGTIVPADAVVSESTGTFSLRASFPNPDRVLLPGMFVQASVDIGETPNAFLVQQRAVTRDAAGAATAYFASADNKAETFAWRRADPLVRLVQSRLRQGNQGRCQLGRSHCSPPAPRVRPLCAASRWRIRPLRPFADLLPAGRGPGRSDDPDHPAGGRECGTHAGRDRIISNRKRMPCRAYS